MKQFLKNLFKFRYVLFLKYFTVYIFQRGRWDLGISVDTNGSTLISFDLIVISFEIDLNNYKQKEPSFPLESYRMMHINED